MTFSFSSSHNLHPYARQRNITLWNESDPHHHITLNQLVQEKKIIKIFVQLVSELRDQIIN